MENTRNLKYAEFNRASLDAIRKWKFQAGSKNGKTVKVRMRLPLDFNIRS